VHHQHTTDTTPPPLPLGASDRQGTQTPQHTRSRHTPTTTRGHTHARTHTRCRGHLWLTPQQRVAARLSNATRTHTRAHTEGGSGSTSDKGHAMLRTSLARWCGHSHTHTPAPTSTHVRHDRQHVATAALGAVAARTRRTAPHIHALPLHAQGMRGGWAATVVTAFLAPRHEQQAHANAPAARSVGLPGHAAMPRINSRPWSPTHARLGAHLMDHGLKAICAPAARTYVCRIHRGLYTRHNPTGRRQRRMRVQRARAPPQPHNHHRSHPTVRRWAVPWCCRHRGSAKCVCTCLSYT
jgi:hypothetical protein